MTVLPFAQIDAFASRAFEGNPACVVQMKAFLADETLQAIAAENNVSETAFIVPVTEGHWQLRWFTPDTEVPLCGHATLAAAHWLIAKGGYGDGLIRFQTRQSGVLTVRRTSDGRLEMDFPAVPATRVDTPDALVAALGVRPSAVFAGGYLAALFDTPEAVMALDPDLRALGEVEGAELEPGCIGCLAPGGPNDADVTSRFFGPGVGIPEDPATGSWHCLVAPLMAPRLGKKALACFQAYPGRGAWIGVEDRGGRVGLTGRAITVIEGHFHL
ncbi:MAG: PhzF family phenazine biosynthesis protein [Pseudomonadota bacterium]